MTKTILHCSQIFFVCGFLITSSIFTVVSAKDFSDIDIAWTETEIIADGQTNDWKGLPTRYLEDPAAAIGIANDATKLHILLRFRDARWTKMIKRDGLTIWIDPKGKKKKVFMLKFRGGPTPEQMQQMGGDQGDRRDRRRPTPEMFAADDQRLFTCAIKDRIEEKSLPPGGTEGPAAAFGVDLGFFTYEFTIPLAEGGVRDYGLGIEPGANISVGAFWGESPEMAPHGERPSGMGGGGRGGGMGGGGGRGGGRMGGGGGMKGGGGGRMGGGKMERPQPVEIWIKTKLATSDSD